MFYFILCLMLCTGLQHAAGADGYTYYREVDAWLRFYTQPATWLAASTRCRLDGGQLATPTNNDITQAMLTAMTAQGFPSLVTIHSVDIGYDTAFNDTARADLSLKLISEDKLPYFCRKEPKNKCGPKDNGYEYDARTGSCYKFHRFSKEWRYAVLSCHSEGAHLAIINSADESKVLNEIISQNPSSTVVNADWDDFNYIYVGMRKWNGGKWGTIYGHELGFDRWASGEPNNVGVHEDCGSILRVEGLLNDIQCWRRLPYICEITP